MYVIREELVNMDKNVWEFQRQIWDRVSGSWTSTRRPSKTEQSYVDYGWVAGSLANGTNALPRDSNSKCTTSQRFYHVARWGEDLSDTKSQQECIELEYFWNKHAGRLTLEMEVIYFGCMIHKIS